MSNRAILCGHSTASLFRSLFFAALCAVLLSTAMHSTARAKECEPGNCNGIKVRNYTDYQYQLQFLLCCDYEYRETTCYDIGAEGASIEFPDGCSILKFAFCQRQLPRGVCSRWYPEECVLVIYYCTWH